MFLSPAREPDGPEGSSEPSPHPADRRRVARTHVYSGAGLTLTVPEADIAARTSLKPAATPFGSGARGTDGDAAEDGAKV
ncbi:hypothetical protein [Streptomyces griseoluteus]|uniref:hypothetical protein n=1 Tax=Streptomyces griseoluteus TaxID=29306 RepID=UPI0036FDE82B